MDMFNVIYIHCQGYKTLLCQIEFTTKICYLFCLLKQSAAVINKPLLWMQLITDSGGLLPSFQCTKKKSVIFN